MPTLRLTGLASGLDTESIVAELMSAERTKSTKVENQITKLDWKIEKWKTLNSKIYSFYTSSLSKMRLQGNYNVKKATSTDESRVTVSASNLVPEGTHTVQVKAVANAQYVTGSAIASKKKITYDTLLSDLDVGDEGSSIDIIVGNNKTVKFEIKENSTVGDFIQALQDAGLNASFDTSLKRFYISSKKSGTENAFSIKKSSGNFDLTKLGLGEITTTVDEESGEVTVDAEGVTCMKPTDALIIYNGVEYKSSSNIITINGMTITAKDVTADNETVNITVNRDNETIYNMIKDFLKSYNELLDELNDNYYADPAKGYEPLTDEQKKAMTDDQIEKWENKIKDSLLRRDDSLNCVISAMRDCLNRNVSVDGKNYSLASFGISSSDYTERGLLHLDGDPDDSLTCTKEDKLMKAISDNPDAVMKVFSELMGDLYKNMTEQMKSTPLRSASTFYNDKELKSTLKDYKDKLSTMQDHLEELEDRYYKQFSRMETMLSRLNSQGSALNSILGINTQN